MDENPRVQIVPCSNFGEALNRIRSQHKPDAWLYRGQTYRRPIHRLAWDEGTIEFENLFPGSFRFIQEHSNVSQALEDEWNKRHAEANAIYHTGFLLLAKEYEKDKTNAVRRFAWMDPYEAELREVLGAEGSSLYAGFDQRRLGDRELAIDKVFWSLMQHYDLVTALLDFTFSLDVAAWFATNPWNAPAEARPLKGEGIIYRVHRRSLTAAILATKKTRAQQRTATPYAPPSSYPFEYDLRHIPPAFALRPTAQHAAVVRGFDDLEFSYLVLRLKAISAFTFPHAADDGSRWPLPLTRNEVIPSMDPFSGLQSAMQAAWAAVPEGERHQPTGYSGPVIVVGTDSIKYTAADGTDPTRFASATPETFYYAGILDVEAGRFKDAIRTLERVITLGVQVGDDRYRDRAYVGIGSAKISDNDPPGAVDAYRKALDSAAGLEDVVLAGSIIEASVQGAAELAMKDQKGESLELLEHALTSIDRRTRTSIVIEDAQARAMYLKGLTISNAQAAAAQLAVVADRFLSSKSEQQRVFAAAAFLELAKRVEHQQEKSGAKRMYGLIVSIFGRETSADIEGLVKTARQRLSLLGGLND